MPSYCFVVFGELVENFGLVRDFSRRGRRLLTPQKAVGILIRNVGRGGRREELLTLQKTVGIRMGHTVFTLEMTGGHYHCRFLLQGDTRKI